MAVSELVDPTLAETEPAAVARLKHHRAVRWMHWINFPLLTVMIWSGMRIYWADLRDPFAVGVGDFDFSFWPDYINEKLGLQQRLARGMAFHFTFGWLFAINGLFYVTYLAFSGQWRQVVPERGALRDSMQVFLHDIGLGRGKPLPPQARYNAAQRLTYTLVIVMGALAVYSGLAIYKPTQLSFMTGSLGGYEWARGIHFSVTIAFLVFFAIHIMQVLRAGFDNFWSMVTGYERIRGDGRAGVITEPSGPSATADPRGVAGAADHSAPVPELPDPIEVDHVEA